MNISTLLHKVISKILAKKQRSKHRVIMRAYRKLKVQRRLHLLGELKSILMDEQFERIKSQASKIMFGASSENASLVVRQYLHIRLLVNLRFSKAILYSLGSGKPIRYPLPIEWREILKKEGYIVDGFSCQLQWILLLFVYFCFGIYRAFGIFKATIIRNTMSVRQLVLPFAYFHNLSHLHVPSVSDGKVSENIIAWYAQWNGRNKNIISFHHDAINTSDCEFDGFNVYYAPLTRLNMGGVKSLFIFVGWFMTALAICIKDVLLLRWWTFLLFEQYVQGAVLRHAEDRMIARDYLLHHTGVFYRPIWTYEAEKRSARVILYFYSTNNTQSFKKIDGYPDTGNNLKLSSWPLILVWDKYQAQYVRRLFHSYGAIEIVGQIWFSSSNYKNNIDVDFKKNISAGIFDVQPHRSSMYKIKGLPTEYYDSKVAIQFLKDVHKVLDDNSIVALHKRKRNVENILHPKYKNILRTFSGESQISIDPDLSPNYLIENVDFVISMPFTSTALMAQYQNKPSIYYDPFGDIQKDDRAAHGIQIIIGIDELQSWVQSFMLQPNKLEDNNR
jgi:polysaccharide biosynthesis PFTS motif protein